MIRLIIVIITIVEMIIMQIVVDRKRSVKALENVPGAKVPMKKSVKHPKKETRKPLNTWSKAEVAQWLTEFKKREGAKFNVSEVACSGASMARRTEDQFKALVGVADGIDLYNAKQNLIGVEWNGENMRAHRRRKTKLRLRKPSSALPHF